MKRLESYPRRFEGQVAVVTGGAQGLGEAFARRFAQEGACVVIIDLQCDKCEQVATQLQEKFCVKTMALDASVSDREAVKGIVSRILDECGQIDIWVNNAGVYHSMPLEDLTMEEWELMLNVNYTGVFVCTQAVAPVMKRQRSGRIINISSIAGRTGFKNSAAYCSTKAAVIGLTRATAMDLAPYNVTVNAVCPGTIMTEMALQVDQQICAQEGWPPGTHLKNKAESIPMKRLGTVEDVAGVVAFLASEDAAYITGQSIEVDGGELLI